MKLPPSTILQAKSFQALTQYFEGAPTTPPRTVYSSECHEKLTVEQIRDAVVLLSTYLGMSGSSGANFDLYKLVNAYLLNPEMRTTFNALLEDWHPPTRH